MIGFWKKKYKDETILNGSNNNEPKENATKHEITNSIDFDGIIFDIIKMDKNSKFKIQSLQQELSEYYHEYIYTLIKLSVLNSNDFLYSLINYSFKLVDNQGNQYEIIDPYYGVRDLIFTNGYTDSISSITPKGRIKTVLIFPKLGKNLTPKYLYYHSYVYANKLKGTLIEGYIKIDLTNNSIETNVSRQKMKEREEREQKKEEDAIRYKEQIDMEREQRKEEYEKSQEIWRKKVKSEQEYKETKKIEKEYIKHKNKIDTLELVIHSRINNILTYKELVKIENTVSNLILEINNMEVRDKDLKNKFLSLESEYYNRLPYELGDLIDFDEKYSVANMTPKEFEVYTFEKFKKMGYSPVLTSEFLDEGIDIILTKDNIKYGVQCKYFKPDRYIGTDIMLHFLGALVNINASYGFLVTTGKITKAAEFIANRNKIQIIKLTV